ncbi:MAG TPA: ABC transporter permease subunit [Candidatus Paceibacterota bacterium]|nr:ABC transporter permease subunit [Candidatus Paceibacterota bacterium]
MIHGHYRVQVYRHKRHAWTAAATLLLPIVILVAFGGLAHIGMRELGITLALSLYRLVASYLVSLVIGVALAIYLGSRKWMDNILPVLDVIQNLPSFALIPLFALLLGYTSFMAIVFSVTAVVWPIFFYVVNAIRTARTDVNEAATVFGATGMKRVFHYYLPLSLPALVTGSIVGVSIGWEAIIGIELIGKLRGIGTFIDTASSSHETAAVWGGILAILALVFVINKAVWTPLIKHTERYAE